MTIDFLTLFPEMFPAVLNTSILKRAQDAGAVSFAVHDLGDWATDRHKTVDDTPYGGGPGMVLKVDVIDRALRDLKAKVTSQKSKVILLTPQGKRFDQRWAEKLAKKDRLILVAGHYEGFDERVRTLVDQEFSIGDYVLTGGELPAMVIADAIARLIPGVLGKDESSHEESFGIRNSEFGFLLEYPQYTRPELYHPTSIARERPMTVPAILKSGNHAKIAAWRREQAQKRTRKRRPDLPTFWG